VREQYSILLAIAAGGLILIVTVVFALIQSPELLDFPESPLVKSAVAIPHQVDGRSDCVRCHGTRGVQPYPARHTGWSNTSCRKCHAAATDAVQMHVEAPSAEKNRAGQPMPHPLPGREHCDRCHGPEGILPYPVDHAGWHNETCTLCHPQGGKGQKQE
jgi:hypothetical protein